MSPFQMAETVAVLIFGACILGIIAAPLLSEAHLSSKSLEIIKDARGIITGLTALTLGLLIANANSSFEDKSNQIKAEAASAIVVDRLLRDFGPKADHARDELKIAVQSEIDRMYDAKMTDADVKKVFSSIRKGKIRAEILKLTPQNDSETWLRSTALSTAQDFLGARWRIFQEMNSGIKWPLVYVAVFWLVAIFFSLGVETPRNVFAISAMFVASLAMAGAMFLMFEMDMPFQGFIRISPAPLEDALHQIAAPA
jgi:hypothetical protein